IRAQKRTKASRLAALDRRRFLFAWRRIFGQRNEERARPARLDRERLGESGLLEDRNTQSVKPFRAALPLRAAHRAHECTVGHALAVREQDLRAAAFDLRLLPIGGSEIRERGLRSDA